MPRPRVTLIWLLVLVALALVGPAAAIADGPSAGDNQYTDPLAGQHHHDPGSSSTTTSTSSAPPANTATSTGSSSPSLSPTSPSSSSSGSASTSSGSSSSTTSTSTTTSTPGTSLPRTGYDSGLAAAIGLALVGAGLLTRRRSRSSTR